MPREIKLNVKSTITRLVGNPYGQEIFKSQVEDIIDYNDINIIIIPDSIVDVGISFIQGFTKNIFLTIDKNQFYKKFEIRGQQKVVDKFREVITL